MEIEITGGVPVANYEEKCASRQNRAAFQPMRKVCRGLQMGRISLLQHPNYELYCVDYHD
jgi:hypothetical protein